MYSVEHTESEVDSILVKEAHDMSLYLHVDGWVEAVTGFAKDAVEKWAAVCKEKRFFEDPRIKEALSLFCIAANEPERYEPLSSMLNRIQEYVVAHKVDFPGLPPALTIKSLVYFPNDTHAFVVSDGQDAPAAKRRPDFVGVMQETVDNGVDGAQFLRAKPMICCELKNTGPLVGLLESRRQHDRLLLSSQNTQEAQYEVRCH